MQTWCVSAKLPLPPYVGCGEICPSGLAHCAVGEQRMVAIQRVRVDVHDYFHAGRGCFIHGLAQIVQITATLRTGAMRL